MTFILSHSSIERLLTICLNDVVAYISCCCMRIGKSVEKPCSLHVGSLEHGRFLNDCQYWNQRRRKSSYFSRYAIVSKRARLLHQRNCFIMRYVSWTVLPSIWKRIWRKFSISLSVGAGKDPFLNCWRNRLMVSSSPFCRSGLYFSSIQKSNG